MVYSVYSQDAAVLALLNGDVDYIYNPSGYGPGLEAQLEGDPNRYPGVRIVERVRRVYPSGPLAAHVLGYLGRSEGGAEHPAFLAASLAFAGGDLDAALERLDRLKEAEPYFYEGDLLAGAIHRRTYEEASRRGATADAERAFEQARRSFGDAATIGESDPRPYEETCPEDR